MGYCLLVVLREFNAPHVLQGEWFLSPIRLEPLLQLGDVDLQVVFDKISDGVGVSGAGLESTQNGVELGEVEYRFVLFALGSGD